MYNLDLSFTLYSPDGAHSRTLYGTVDTGASFTVVPEGILDELGIVRGELLLFSLADGSIQERCIGYALMELESRSEVVTVVFGSSSRKALIGAESLVELRLAVDLVNERLIPVDRIVLLKEDDKP